jgi:hypothetical protein
MSTDDQQPALVDPVTARQLREIQSAMLEQLKILTSEESMERGKTLVIQQALMIHAIDRLSDKMEAAGERLELAVVRINSAFWGLMKVPVACVLIVSASWAYLYSQVISENTWLIMMAVAAFPWLGDSISAIAKIFGLSRGNNNAGAKK